MKYTAGMPIIFCLGAVSYSQTIHAFHLTVHETSIGYPRIDSIFPLLNSTWKKEDGIPRAGNRRQLL